MIIPITLEAEWMPLVLSAASWQPPASKLLVVAPHPDDETLSIGGFLAAQVKKGVEVSVVAVTDGENAYAHSRGLAETRRQERKNALRRLGVEENKTIRLGLPDGDVISHEAKLAQALRQFTSKETHILAPWPGDFHPDHEACGRAAQQASQHTAALTFYFFWTWHRGTPVLLNGASLRSLPLSARQQQIKAQALAENGSQLEHRSGEPILPPNLLWPAKLPFEVFLPA